jgi:hybrid polyketide synthase/nonribosomal peptide synthetase ACE1
MPLIELGLDSLVAVDIRTWFLQELKIDLPVLKILGGASAVDLITLAVERLPEDLVPKFGETPAHNPKPTVQDHSKPAELVPLPPAKLVLNEQLPSKDDVLMEPTISVPSSATSTSPSQPSPPSEASSIGVESHTDELKTPPSESEIDNKDEKVPEAKHITT